MSETEFKYKNPYGSTKGKFQQYFNIKETVKMAGKEICWYDMIQEAREDTEIYPTLEKYGSLEKIPMDAKKTCADFTEYKDLRSLKEQQIKANEMWTSLPWDIRAKFDNNIHTFIEKGEKFAQDMLKNDLSQATVATIQQQEPQPKEKE